MNYLSIAALALLASVLVFTACTLFTAIRGNYRSANELRRQFALRIRLLPLFRLLQKKHISLAQWLHQFPVATIEGAIRRCESCHEVDKCLSLLKQQDSHKLDHCANAVLFEEAVEFRQ